MSIPPNIEILVPWRAIESADHHSTFSDRLKNDMPPKHVLHGVEVTAVATRIDRDDVLFEVQGGEMPLAVVHMTWRKETDPHWPSTKLFRSWEHWASEDLQPAHQEYTGS